MTTSLNYVAIAGSKVTLFFSALFRYAMPWGGHVHLAAPMTYKVKCPVTKVLSMDIAGAELDYLKEAPLCTQEDPLLAGCWGIPEDPADQITVDGVIQRVEMPREIC